MINTKMKLVSLIMLLILSTTSLASAATIPLQAAFTADPIFGNAPLVVLFTDHSTGYASVYNWTFGDGGVSINVNPAHTYINPGNYTVTLTITKGPASSSVSHVIKVPGRDAATAHPHALFVASPLKGTTSTTIYFTDRSTGKPTAWLWTFGDGKYSRVQNPTHKYAKAGVYTVRLQVWNSQGACSQQFVNYITVR